MTPLEVSHTPNLPAAMRLQSSFPWLPAPVARVGRRGGHIGQAARVAPAAVRIPDPRLVQLPLTFVHTGPQIFVHEGARQLLERRFESSFPGPVQLAVTDNRHRMVTHAVVDGVLKLRVHMMFLGAPEWVLDALVAYVLHDDRHASQVIGQYIHQNSFRIRASQPVTVPLRTKGRRHDLLAVMSAVNERYFASSITDVLVTWGRRTRPRTKKRRTIKLGSYSAVERLVRIHPALDQEWVPRYFVAYIVYHELLHHLLPPLSVGSRALLHSAEFRRREREFHHYDRAIAWERKHLDRLLRSR